MKKISYIVIMFFSCYCIFSSEPIVVKSNIVTNLIINSDVNNLKIVNNGDNEHDFLQVSFPEINSSKYKKNIIPTIFIIIQNDDPEIDTSSILQGYMMNFQNSLNGINKNLQNEPNSINGFSDQVYSSYEFTENGKTLNGLLFVGKKNGFVYIAYSIITDDLFEQSIPDFEKLLSVVEVQK